MHLRTPSPHKLIYGIIFLFLVYFILLPVVSIVFYGISSSDSLFFTTKGFQNSFIHLRHSLSVAIIVTIMATVLGLILAFTLHRMAFAGKRVLKALVLLPFINPPFVGSIAYIMLFGKRGLITHQLLGLTISPFGMRGIVTVQVLGLTALAYLLISSAIQKTDISLEEAARTMGASEGKVLLTVTLPMMAPEIAGTALLVFLASMSDFSTPLIIGGSYQTLASNLYIQITGLYDMQSAALSGIILLLPCFMAFWLHKYHLSKRSYFSDDTTASAIVNRTLPRHLKGMMIGISTLYLTFLLGQYLFIVLGALTKQWGYDYTFSLAHFQSLKGTQIKPFINSFKLASATALFASGTGVFLAYLLKLHRPKFATAADLFATLPAAVPGILFGIGYLVTFRYPILGIGKFWLTPLPSIVLLGTKAIVYLICIARFMNIGLRAGYALLEHVHPDIENASYNLGAGQARTFFSIMLPQMKSAFFASFLRSFSDGMVTLGAIILLIIPSNKVAVQQIFTVVKSNASGDAAAIALLLSFMTLIFLGFYYLLFNFRDVIKRLKAPFKKEVNA
ncbi:MAG: iron(III) transport system permease protein [Clostridiales bacterium]|jgi:iron(III) transport system permease protein|nr:iron(III) transport system permease protein [Clostridiales bacterium]MDN5298784.1 iron(III) transport system permease protein [Clostridiales bacterium]